MHMGLAQRPPCGLGRRVPPRGTELCYGRLGGGLRNGVLAFPRHWHPTAMPPAHSRATQAPRPRSARAPFDLVQSGGWLPPPHSSQVSHQRATLKPSTLGESGWASRVARASQMHTKCPGTRFGHFGAARETSPGRIATPRGKRRPMAHGGGCGILVCILRSLGRALYGSGRGRVPFRPALLEGWYPANATPSVSPTRKPRVTNR